MEMEAKNLMLVSSDVNTKFSMVVIAAES